ncbi:MAG: hypothetical protein WCE58_12170, partial [Gallionella sp.]
ALQISRHWLISFSVWKNKPSLKTSRSGAILEKPAQAGFFVVLCVWRRGCQPVGDSTGRRWPQRYAKPMRLYKIKLDGLSLVGASDQL